MPAKSKKTTKNYSGSAKKRGQGGSKKKQANKKNTVKVGWIGKLYDLPTIKKYEYSENTPGKKALTQGCGGKYKQKRCCDETDTPYCGVDFPFKSCCSPTPVRPPTRSSSPTRRSSPTRGRLSSKELSPIVIEHHANKDTLHPPVRRSMIRTSHARHSPTRGRSPPTRGSSSSPQTRGSSSSPKPNARKSVKKVKSNHDSAGYGEYLTILGEQAEDTVRPHWRYRRPYRPVAKTIRALQTTLRDKTHKRNASTLTPQRQRLANNAAKGVGFNHLKVFQEIQRQSTQSNPASNT